MTRYEIQHNDCFFYVIARTQDEARAAFIASLSSSFERRWANPIFTGRDIIQ